MILFMAVQALQAAWVFLELWRAGAALQRRGVGFSLAVASRACSPVAGCGLLTTVAPLVAKHGLWCPQTCSAAPGLESPGPVAVMHGLSCSATCGLPRPGVELASPALAGGRFFTTEPPGKPSGVF